MTLSGVDPLTRRYSRSHSQSSTQPRRPGAVPTGKEAVLKDGNLFLQNIEVPNEVLPGGVVDVDATASNGALSVNGLGNPDCCGPFCSAPGTYALNGYSVEVLAALDGAVDRTGEFCLGTTESGTKDEDVHLQLPAPDDQDLVGNPKVYTVTITLRLTGSETTASTSRLVTIGGCRANSDCPGSDVCGPDNKCHSSDNGNGDGGGDCEFNSDCAPSEICLGGTCVPRDSDGTSCDSDAGCPSSQVCNNGTCAPGLFGVPRNQALVAGGGVAIGVTAMALRGNGSE